MTQSNQLHPNVQLTANYVDALMKARAALLEIQTDTESYDSLDQQSMLADLTGVTRVGLRLMLRTAEEQFARDVPTAVTQADETSLSDVTGTPWPR